MPNIKTEEDAFCVDETMKHKILLSRILNRFAKIIADRAEAHDQSKLEDPEFSLFSKWTPALAKMTYGSKEYEEALTQLKPALEHHYANNRHHPEHFKNGIHDMNILDILEMFVDWYCASKRHNDGNIRKSIEINKTRFNFSEELATIFENSIELLD
ncbi:MAG TPA: DUF5662 family protein [Methanofastidiosum sp.]|nr:DUF5662 family protein [Methanofastidiosum sp.]